MPAEAGTHAKFIAYPWVAVGPGRHGGAMLRMDAGMTILVGTF